MPAARLLRSFDRLSVWASTAALLLAACSAEPEASDGLDPSSDNVTTPRELMEGHASELLPPASTELLAPQNYQGRRPDSNLLTDPVVPSDLVHLVKRLAALYGPEAELRNRPLLFVLKDYAQSGAWNEPKTAHWEIQVSRMLLAERLPNDMLSAILCHEIGHLFGGFPFGIGVPGRALRHDTPGASEGQADYFTTKDCLPRLWAAEHEQNARFRKAVRPAVRQQCDAVWKNVKAQNLCYRSAQTSEEFSAWLASRHQERAPDLLTPDTSAVTATSSDHPSPQCRLDTLFQGALCPRRIAPGVIPGFVGNRVTVDADEIAANYSCTSGVGARPACWFVPNEPLHDCSSVPTDTCGTKDGQEGRWTCTGQSGPVFAPCADGQVCHDERSGCHGDDSAGDAPAP